jgi:hypothetical protein
MARERAARFPPRFPPVTGVPRARGGENDKRLALGHLVGVLQLQVELKVGLNPRRAFPDIHALIPGR